MDNETKTVNMIRSAYLSGDFAPLFPLMTDDYEHISFWVLEVKRGKANAMAYYTDKGNAIKKGGKGITGSIVKIETAPDRVRPNSVWQEGRRYLEPECFMHRNDAGKLAVLMEQRLEHETVRTLAIPTFTDDGKLRQILITEPNLYRFTAVPDSET